MASNVYHEVIQVEVRDQSQAALTTVQRNVEKTETMLNRVSKAPFTIVVKVTDMLTRPLAAMISSATSLVRRGLSLPVSMVDRVTGPLRGMMQGLSGAGANILQGVGQGVGMTVLGLVSQGFGAVKGSIIDMNATLETSTLQFETLMGDADAARSHVADLFEFAKKTPFETQPVIDASRTLRTFGGSALDTMDNLTLFGNASAATSADIKEVSFWFGRAYAAMQGGQPYGEATMRLQELAVVSPQAAQKLEQLQKAGGSADAQWRLLTGDLNRFNGAMDRQASTWEGLTSTMSDSIKLTSAKMFQPLFKVAKNAVSALNDVFSSDAFNQWADSAGNAIADFVQGALDNVGKFIDVVKAIGTAFTTDKGAIGVVYDIIRKTFGDGVANFVQPFLQKFMDFIPTLQSVGRWIGWAFQDLMKGDFKNFGKDLVIAFQQLTGIDLSGVLNFVTEVAGPAVANAIDWLANTGWPMVQQAMSFVASLISTEIGPAFAAVGGMLKDWIIGAWTWFTGTAWPTLYGWFVVVSDYVNGTVLPALDDLAKKLQPLLEGAWKAATNAATGFYTALTEGKPALDAANTDYGALNIVLQPLVMLFTDFGRLGSALGKIFGGLSDVFGRFVATIVQLPAQLLLVLAVPFAPFLAQMAGFINLFHLAVDAISAFADTAPSWGTALDSMGEALQNFWQMIQKWPAQFKQFGADILNGLIQGMASVDVGAWIATNVTSKIPDFIRDRLGIHSPSSVMADIGSSLMQGLVNGLTARLPDILSFMSNLSNIFGGTDVGSWIDAAIRATGVSSAWAGPLSQIIQYESGGNPSAANLTDINAQNGNASVGLMQLTASNRAAYTPSGMNPMDPVAQIIAGIKYIQDRYGDISNVPGVRSLAGGGGYVPYDRGGVLSPGLTLAANNTRANEYVFTPGQLAGIGGNVVNFVNNFEVHAEGAAPGVGEEVSAALEESSSRLFTLLGSQLRVAFGNMATEGGAT